MTRGRLWAAWAATRAVMFLLLVLPRVGGPTLFGDMRHYERWAEGIRDWSSVPYRDFVWEYPPGAALVITPPAWFGSYQRVFVLLMLACDALVVYALVRLADRLGSDRGPWLWVGGILLLGPIAFTRYDSVSALLAVVAMLGLAAAAPIAAGLALGGGIVMKLWPAVLLVVLPFVPRPRRVLAATGAALLATVVAVLATGGGEHGGELVRRHTGRGLQVESLVATPVVIAERAGADVDISLHPSSGSWDVTGTGEHLALNASTLLTAAALALILALAVRARRRPETYLDLAAVALLLLTVTGKILSPQYLIWLFAVLAAALCRRGSPLGVPAAVVAASAVLTQAVYPVWYSDLVNGEGLLVVVALTVRNVLLLVAAVLAVRALWRSTARP